MTLDKRTEVIVGISNLDASLDIKGIEINPYKNRIIFANEDTYHIMAQQSGCKTLTNTGGSLFYRMNFPCERNNTLWEVALEGDRVNEFLEKYGKSYQIEQFEYII